MGDIEALNGNIVLKTDTNIRTTPIGLKRVDVATTRSLAEIDVVGSGPNALSGVITFGTSDPGVAGGAIQERARIHADGNFGIGTAAPTERLEVAGTVKAKELVSEGLRIGTDQLVLNAGKLGIGTATPDEALDVRGGAKVQGAVSWGAGASMLHGDQGGSIELGTSTLEGTIPYIDFHFGVGVEQDFNVRIINDGDGQLSLVAGAVRALGDVYWGGGAARLRNDQGGSIELGTSTLEGAIPYIDFHFGVGAEQDFNTRIINDGDGQLSLVAGLLRALGNVSWGGGSSMLSGDQGGSIELGTSTLEGTIPYIDFHFGVGAEQDFNMRIINDGDHQLSIDGGNLHVHGNVHVGGELTQHSSRTVKSNIRSLTADQALAVLDGLQPVEFTFAADPEQRQQIGFIAEDSPASVASADGLGINPMCIIAVMARMLREHQQALSALRSELAAVRAQR